jgi:nitrous oxidase accessory protein
MIKSSLNRIEAVIKILIILILIFYSYVDVRCNVITVIEHNSVNMAVQQAQNGDTVLIRKGTYLETSIKIKSELTIIGEKGSVINAEGRGENVIEITSDNVTITGLEIQNVAVSYVSDNAAVKLIKVKNCKVSNCRIYNGFFGIYLAKSYHCKIENNDIISSGKKESSNGNGIHLWQCSNIEVANNKVSGHRDGIYFEFVKHGIIFNNLSERNVRYGLHFMFSDSCKYENNTFRHNGAGVAVMYTKCVEMTGNRFLNNWGTASYGLLLKDIKDSFIKNNIFKTNTVGIHCEGSNKILIENNEFIDNGWALRIMANCSENNFKSNNFIGNSFDLSTNSTRSDNTFSGNYWSRYKGYDLNHDGFGDIPFRPVTLFSVLVQKYEPTVILLHSLFLDLLNFAENLFPSLIPPTLVDNHPSMEKIS